MTGISTSELTPGRYGDAEEPPGHGGYEVFEDMSELSSFGLRDRMKLRTEKALSRSGDPGHTPPDPRRDTSSAASAQSRPDRAASRPTAALLTGRYEVA